MREGEEILATKTQKHKVARKILSVALCPGVLWLFPYLLSKSALGCAAEVFCYPVYHAHLFFFGDVVIERKSEQPRAKVFCQRQVTFAVAKPVTHRRCMQRHIMEYCLNVILFE